MSLKKKVIHGQSRQIIFNISQFMKREKESGNFVISINNVQERVAEATGVSLRTVQRIAKEGAIKPEGSKFASPRKTIFHPIRKAKVDEFDERIIRNVIYTYLTVHKRRPNMKAVLEAVRNEGVNVPGKISSFRKIVQKLGFRWKKTVDNKRIIIEKTDIRLKRTTFLRNLKQYKEEGRNIVYSDETCVPSASQRLVVVHCGGKKGFVPNAGFLFKGSAKPNELNEDLNLQSYKIWLEEKLLPNLEPNSILIIDNESYLNALTEPNPTSTWKKTEMQRWLNERSIFFLLSETKPELYKKIKMNKSVHQNFIVDQLLVQHGHSVLRLPPNHPELNPIKKIWVMLKSHVAKENGPLKFDEVWKLVEEKLSSIRVKDWEAICKEVQKTEDEYLLREYMTDDAQELIVSVDGNSDSDDSDGYFSSDEDDNLESEDSSTSGAPPAFISYGMGNSSTNGASSSNQMTALDIKREVEEMYPDEPMDFPERVVVKQELHSEIVVKEECL